MTSDLSQWRDQTPDPVWAELQRLKAELANLTPSGEVEKDVEAVRDAIAARRRTVPVLEALSRLAAQAQGYEAMKAERDEWQKRAQEYAEKAQNTERLRIVAEAERDAAVADNAAWERLAQRFLAIGQYMADTLAGLTHHPALKAGGHIEAHGQIISDWAALAEETRSALKAHPGAALLAEHAKAIVRARNEGREDAVAELKSAAYSETGDMITRIRARKEPES